jgi:hypothetical protein
VSCDPASSTRKTALSARTSHEPATSSRSKLWPAPSTCSRKR